MNNELKDLEQEVVDAQLAFDTDWYTLTTTMNHIQKSYAFLEVMKKKLEEYKKLNNG